MTATSEPRKLYGVAEVAEILGVNRTWIHNHTAKGGPPPDFQATAGKKQMMLWTPMSVDRWRAYRASGESCPSVDRYLSFSDHNAVNNVGGLTVTWKLWWRNTHDGGALWWFSTPRGWYVSNDDGRTWDFADTMVRPGGYRYMSVNGSVIPNRAVAAILRSAEKLRRELEGGET